MSENRSELLCQRGGLTEVGKELRERFRHANKICLVCDETVFGLYGDRISDCLKEVGFTVTVSMLPVADTIRTEEWFRTILNALVTEEFTKQDMVIGFGGSDIISLAGFTAANYLHSIPFIEIPTTLEAMVNLNWEGRYDLDSCGMHNAIGVTNTPAYILCDISLLDTLPQEELQNGFGFIMKYSMIGCDEVTLALKKFGWKPGDDSSETVSVPSEKLLEACISAKASLLEDETKKPLLSFGETMAEALSFCHGYQIKRGFVLSSAMGIVADASVRNGFCSYKRYRYLVTRLMQLGLPTGISEGSKDDADKVMSRYRMIAERTEENEIRDIFVNDCGCATELLTDDTWETLWSSYYDNTKTVKAVAIQTNGIELPVSSDIMIRMMLAWFLDDFTVPDISHIDGTLPKIMSDSLKALQTGGKNILPCNGSKDIAELLIPVIGVLNVESVTMAVGTDPEQPDGKLIALLCQHGMQAEKSDDRTTLTIRGHLSAGEYRIPDTMDCASICGLLFTLPLLQEDSILRMEGEPNRKELIYMTINLLHRAGVEITISDDAFEIPGRQQYNRYGLQSTEPESDWELASYWKALEFVSGETIPLYGLSEQSMQTERRITELLERLRETDENGIMEADITNCLRCAEAIALAASVSPTVTTKLEIDKSMTNREQNRIQVLCTVLHSLGAKISMENRISEISETDADGNVSQKTVTEDGLIIRIEGIEMLTGGMVDACESPNAAMLAAVAAWACEQPVTITGADAVRTVFPDFWNQLKQIEFRRNEL